MIRKFTLFLFFYGFLYTQVNSQCTGNYLLNPSFETPVQTGNTNGNNFPGTNPWGSWTMPGLGSNAFNVIRVDGSGYGGGPNNAQDGIQYLDINGLAGTVTQSFTLGCPADITFSGWFSSREASGSYTNWTASIEILNSSNTVIATSTTRNFTNADGDNNPSEAVWYQLTGSITNLASGNYTYRVNLGDYGNFDNAFLCANPGCLLLPVTLLSFSGQLLPSGKLLEWKVVEETNVFKYEIQRSINGIDYQAIGEVLASATNTSEKTYRYTDTENIRQVIIYYRLRIIDIDGRQKYSSVIRMSEKNNRAIDLNVYPNPVTSNTLTAIINTNKRNIAATLLLLNAEGKLIANKKFVTVAGTQNISLDMSGAPTGIYLLKLNMDTESQSIRVIKK